MTYQNPVVKTTKLIEIKQQKSHGGVTGIRLALLPHTAIKRDEIHETTVFS